MLGRSFTYSPLFLYLFCSFFALCYYDLMTGAGWRCLLFILGPFTNSILLASSYLMADLTDIYLTAWPFFSSYLVSHPIVSPCIFGFDAPISFIGEYGLSFFGVPVMSPARGFNFFMYMTFPSLLL